MPNVSLPNGRSTLHHAARCCSHSRPRSPFEFRCVWRGLALSHGMRTDKSADKEFAEVHVLFLRAQQKIEVDHVSVRRFGRMNRDRVFLFEHDVSVRRDEFHQRAPGHAVGRFLQIEQPHESLLALVFLPVIESVHAMKAGEDAVLPRMIRRTVLRQHDSP